ncbi:DUF4386 family protein [Alphaproteobacteria bacterium GH1-50]|uniref:DUF4386 family protein n=1 Tax=Kangsaoukella pontilimi TaxID=2691042 RepID=A0A7C9IIR1_9RHOB|nr:DUF4386 domain-containing protein [Kangsaoukella pontilimi]MXQ09387.1 DUF4386 family protein [Kangsaoukella pontilimi]
MHVFNDPQSKRYARIAGLFYLTIAVAGGYAIAYVPAELFGGKSAGTLAEIAARPGFFLSGIAGDVVMMLAEVVVTAMLFFMFRPVSPALSLAAALARFAMVAVMATMLFFQAALYMIATGAMPLDGMTGAMRADLGDLLRAMHDAGVWIWQIFFTVHLWLLGALVLTSGWFPRLLGLGLIVGGTGYLVDSIHAFALPDMALLGILKVALLIIVTLSELGFALWLVIRGPRVA